MNVLIFMGNPRLRGKGLCPACFEIIQDDQQAVKNAKLGVTLQIVGNAVLSIPSAKRHDLHHNWGQYNDLGHIEPPKSFRNAEDSVPYGRMILAR